MTTEKHLFDLCSKLQSISGKNDKIAFITEHKDDKVFLDYLKVLLDKLIVFGIKTQKLNKFANKGMKGEFQDTDIFSVFEYLQENNTGSDTDAQFVVGYIDSLPDELQKWASASITKTLKLGVTAKSVNKALGFILLVEFNVQRGKSFSDEAHKFEEEDKLTSEKFNGIRGICEVNSGIPVYKTRQNQIIEGLQDLIKDMTGMPDGVYEGEILVKNREQYKLRNVLQQTIKIVESDDPDKKVDWAVFDYLTHEEFAEPATSRGYFERKAWLFDNVETTDNIFVAKTLYLGKSNEEIYRLLEEVVAQGKEGLMVNLDRPYQKDKTNHILKVKKKYTSDLRVIGFEEGKSTGKHAGTLGAFVLEYKGNTVNCGIMPDNIRHDAWANPDKYLNTIVEIKHEQETTNQKNDLVSIEYPVFVAHRTDKDEHSYAHGDD